jgi:hypothetical protein
MSQQQYAPEADQPLYSGHQYLTEEASAERIAPFQDTYWLGDAVQIQPIADLPIGKKSRDQIHRFFKAQDNAIPLGQAKEVSNGTLVASDLPLMTFIAMDTEALIRNKAYLDSRAPALSKLGYLSINGGYNLRQYRGNEAAWAEYSRWTVWNIVGQTRGGQHAFFYIQANHGDMRSQFTRLDDDIARPSVDFEPVLAGVELSLLPGEPLAHIGSTSTQNQTPTQRFVRYRRARIYQPSKNTTPVASLEALR